MRVLERSHLSYSLAWIVKPLLEAALLLPTQLMPTEVEDQEEVILFLSSAQKLAGKAIKKHRSKPRRNIELGTGTWWRTSHMSRQWSKACKLSWPWHRPHWVVSHENPDVTVVNIYFLQEIQIQICTYNKPGWPLVQMISRLAITGMGGSSIVRACLLGG